MFGFCQQYSISYEIIYHPCFLVLTSIVPINLFELSPLTMMLILCKGNLCFCFIETSHRSHSVTCDYGATSHHSPRSTLEMLPCISSLELNPSSFAAGSSNNPNSNLLPGPENRSAYVFNCRIQGKEIPNL